MAVLNLNPKEDKIYYQGQLDQQEKNMGIFNEWFDTRDVSVLNKLDFISLISGYKTLLEAEHKAAQTRCDLSNLY